MEKKKSVKVSQLLINDIYADGLIERVYYAGMPNDSTFSIIESVKGNRFESGEFDHRLDYELQWFYPVGTKEIDFCFRKGVKLKNIKVAPSKLEAVVETEEF